jgi:hypothetical protein
MCMAFEDDFDELNRLLSEKSIDYEKMRATLQRIRRLKEFARMMTPATDRLYAAIARGHRKVFKHLEAGDVEAATRETAKVIAWFYIRFQGDDPSMMTRCPQCAEEVSGVREIAARSELLKDAISKTTGTELHEA